MRKRDKYILIVAIVAIIPLVFASYKFMNKWQDFKKLNPPTHDEFNIKGRWQVVEKFNYKSNSEDKLTTEYCYFDKDRMLINNSLYDGLNYKLRVLRLGGYLKNEYGLDYKRFTDKDEEVDVISAVDGNTLISEIIKIEKDKLVVIYNSNAYVIKYINSDIEDMISKNEEIDKKESRAKDPNIFKEGVFIGLKKARNIETGRVGQEEYKTMWISVENGEMKPTYERENIFYPRLKGFWELEPKRFTNYLGANIEYFNTYNIEEKTSNDAPTYTTATNNNENRYVNLNFISNNYISIEEFTKEYTEQNSRYKVIPVDNVNAQNGVSIDVLAGAEGYKAFKNSTEVALDNASSASKHLKLDSSNITVVRKNGRWVLEGKAVINKEEFQCVTFDINMVNMKKLVPYDNLYVRWNKVKSQNPLTKDVYTSPDGKIAIVIIDDYVLVYKIKEYQLIGEPIGKIKKDKNETVIMSEWTNGDIVDRWEKAFITEAKKIDN